MKKVAKAEPGRRAGRGKRLDTTEYLLKSAANAKRLLESLAEARAGKFTGRGRGTRSRASALAVKAEEHHDQ